MRRFTLPNLFLTVDGDEEEEQEEGQEEGKEEQYQHRDTPRCSPRALKESDEDHTSTSSSPRTPASPRRLSNFPSTTHCPLHCPNRSLIPQDAEGGTGRPTETVPEEEEIEQFKSGGMKRVTEGLSTLTVGGEEVGEPSKDSPSPSSPSTLSGNGGRPPKSPKSPRSPISPRYLKMFPRSAFGADTEDGSRVLVCTCPDSCLQDIGMQEAPLRRGNPVTDSLRARIDSYRRQDTGALGVPREKRSHSLVTPGSFDLAGSRRGLRPDALMFKGGFVRSKFKNRHQLSVQESIEFSDDASTFPGTPPPQSSPPVHKDIPILSSKAAKRIAKEGGSLVQTGLVISKSAFDDEEHDENNDDNETDKNNDDEETEKIDDANESDKT